MIRHGVVVATPHIHAIRVRDRILPELVEEWRFFDDQQGRAPRAPLDLPTKVLNDAEVAGAGVMTGTGLRNDHHLGTGWAAPYSTRGRTRAPHRSPKASCAGG